MRRSLLAVALVIAILAVAGCAGASRPDTHGGAAQGIANPAGAAGSPAASPTLSQASPPIESVMPAASGGGGDSWVIRVVDAAGEELCVFDREYFIEPPANAYGSPFTFIYSTINNWPATRFYAATGHSVAFLLAEAGVLETAQTVTFRAADGYEAGLTRDQLFSEQFYFPNAGEGGAGAAPVVPIVAVLWCEGTDDTSDIREGKPVFLFGQRNPFEHTNPAFVVGVTEIVVDDSPCESWDAPGTFPQPGQIGEGDMVKLQHPYFGLVKLHYTLDGSDPTLLSPMYNPSTYQLELNRPITITEPTTIKAFASGYGKNDSEIATFEFWPAP